MRVSTTIFAAAAVTGLSSCTAPGEPPAARSGDSTFLQIESEADFQARAVGRPFAFPNGDIGQYNSDGTWAIEGVDGPVASGTWEWSGDSWCREGQSRQGSVARECQIIEVSGSGLRFTRSDGTTGTLTFVG